MAGEALDPERLLPDLQLLHSADSLQAQRPRSVRHRLSAVRQGGLWTDLGRGQAMMVIGSAGRHRYSTVGLPRPFPLWDKIPILSSVEILMTRWTFCSTP